jgi:hypothetical protein
MGMDAKVDIWVGVRDNDCDIEELIEQLPSDMFDEERQEFWQDEDLARVIEKYGCAPERIFCSDEVTGFGLKVFHHDWNDGAAEFDCVGLSFQIEEARRNMVNLFKTANIGHKVGVWCQTDFR